MDKQTNAERGVTSFLRALINCLELVVYIQNQKQLSLNAHHAKLFSNTLFNPYDH